MEGNRFKPAGDAAAQPTNAKVYEVGVVVKRDGEIDLENGTNQRFCVVVAG